MILNENPTRLIDWFDDFNGPQPFDFLSNFKEGYPIRWADHYFPTSEHAFAWAKVDPQHPNYAEWESMIRTAIDPGQAKMYGRMCPLRPDWEAVKFDIMRDIVFTKFTRHGDLGALLHATGNAYLQEGTYWNDRVWGVDLTTSDDPWEREGTNWLGTILMEVRTRLAYSAGR